VSNSHALIVARFDIMDIKKCQENYRRSEPDALPYFRFVCFSLILAPPSCSVTSFMDGPCGSVYPTNSRNGIGLVCTVRYSLGFNVVIKKASFCSTMPGFCERKKREVTLFFSLVPWTDQPKGLVDD